MPKPVPRQSPPRWSTLPLVCAFVAAGCARGPGASEAPASSALPDIVPAELGPQPEPRTDTSAAAYAKVEFFPGTTYDKAISRPEQLFGAAIGSRLAHHHESRAMLKRWAEQSPRMQLLDYGRTHEGRELMLAVISSAENLSRLEQIRTNIARLADPRGLAADAATAIVKDTPAVAWLGYSIHGDETSGADAALEVAYHLAAGSSPELDRVLDQLVIVLDPMINPDGRERIISQIEQASGVVRHTNYSGMHRGRWPYGRGDHYHFDLNRDWFAGVNPGTRARWRAIRAFNPQLFVDAHEMSPLDTFLFYPRAEPKNPHSPQRLGHWTGALAADNARAFDRLGWSYYTREWADGWYPGYTDAWTSLTGAIGMLYEQARFAGQTVKRAAGEEVSYREAVHAQSIASWANLLTVAANREAILKDYLEHRQTSSNRGSAALVVEHGVHPDREARWLASMLEQGVEVHRADRSFTCSDAASSLGAQDKRFAVEAGDYLIYEGQPQGAVVRATLEFDTQIPEASLRREREKLENGEGSTIYDVTAWNLPHAHDLRAHWCTPKVPAAQVPRLDPAKLTELVEQSQTFDPAPLDQAYAWVVDGRSDASVRFAVQAMEAGIKLRLGEKKFKQGDQEFARGSLLIRRRENPGLRGATLADVAARTGTVVHAVASGRSPDDGPDLGGQTFNLLARPRIALLGNAPVSASDYGHIWHLLDQTLKVPFTSIDAQSFAYEDLRRYNVLVVPPSDGRINDLWARNAESLARWIEAGGTLVALGAAARSVAQERHGLSDVRLRRDHLKQLPAFHRAVAREQAARRVKVDVDALFENPAQSSSSDSSDDQGSGGDPETLAELDAWQRRFAPSGVILRGHASQRSWLTLGADSELPVFVSGSGVLLDQGSADAVVRLADSANLRLSGLLWPEARERLAHGAYATVESRGHGQVILFADNPSFRGYFSATARLLANALVYGPGVGADPAIEW